MLFWIYFVINTLLYVYSGVLAITFLSYWFPIITEVKFFKFIVNLGSFYLDFFKGKIVISFIDFGTYIGLGIYGAILSASSLLFLIF